MNEGRIVIEEVVEGAHRGVIRLDTWTGDTQLTLHYEANGDASPDDDAADRLFPHVLARRAELLRAWGFPARTNDREEEHRD